MKFNLLNNIIIIYSERPEEKLKTVKEANGFFLCPRKE